jgi:hypothetical protein
VHPLETYLEELAALRASGAAVKETSGCGALANLLNVLGSGPGEIGASLDSAGKLTHKRVCLCIAI